MQQIFTVTGVFKLKNIVNHVVLRKIVKLHAINRVINFTINYSPVSLNC